MNFFLKNRKFLKKIRKIGTFSKNRKLGGKFYRKLCETCMSSFATCKLYFTPFCLHTLEVEMGWVQHLVVDPVPHLTLFDSLK